MGVLILKPVATPLLILGASLAGRRWGESVTGWFVGLPVTSGPVVFFLALEEGSGFATSAATGLLGTPLSGLAATHPVLAAVLAAFPHHARGGAAATGVLRGLLVGLFGFVGFFAVLASTIERLGIAAATVLGFAIQGATFTALRR